MVPSIDELEEYFQSLHRFLTNSLATSSPDLPNIREAVHRLWVDISRFGPPSFSSFPDIHVPGLGPFEVPPPPPPPPPPSTLIENASDWIVDHPWKSSGMAVTAFAGLLAGYTTFRMTQQKRRIRSTTVTPEKRQVVVLLGGDHPLGLPIIIELEKQGYIVITSVSTLEAVSNIETKGHGYVRALVLDPNEPGTIPVFLRSLASTLSRRFPITASGDPYAATPYHPLLHSIISLLTLPTPSVHTALAPLEQLSLRSTYLPHLLSTHFAPLQALQALLPLLRADSQRSRSRKSIIVCLPAADARVGLPFSAVSAMSAAATLRALDVLRREASVAKGMSSIRIVTVDVGLVRQTSVSDAVNEHVMDDWTPSEKAAYGPAFAALGETSMGRSRKPEDISVLINSILGVVSAGTKTTTAGKTICGINVGVRYQKIRDWIRGDRFSVGAGAGTYTFASFLPGTLLDGLLSLPHMLVGVRNWLLPVPPAQPPTDTQPVPSVPSSAAVSVLLPPSASTSWAASRSPRPSISQAVESLEQNEPLSEPEDISGPDTGSEADIESNEGDGDVSAVESSWVSLGPRED